MDRKKPMIRSVLEAQRYTPGPLFIHVGYVNFVFESRQEAAEFYYEQYPGHRSINRDGNWTSDWSAYDGLRYIVVRYTGQDIKKREDMSDIVAASLNRMDEDVQTKHHAPQRYNPPIMTWEYYKKP